MATATATPSTSTKQASKTSAPLPAGSRAAALDAEQAAAGLPRRSQLLPSNLTFAQMYKMAVSDKGTVFYADILLKKEEATDILENYNKTNYRNLRSGKAYDYGKLMDKGLFLWNPDGIIFDVSGQLQQGQHRLHGFFNAETNDPQPFHLTFNSPDEVAKALDVGLTRTIVDIIRNEFGEEGASKYGPILKRVHFGDQVSLPKLLPVEVVELWPLYADAIKTAVDAFPTTQKKGITSGSVKASIARAFLMGKGKPYPLATKRGIDNETLLKEFAEKVFHGDRFSGDDSDDWLALLRQFLKGADAAGATNQLEIYRKTERALKGWLDCEKAPAQLKARSAELFPLPVEIQKKVDGIGNRPATAEDLAEQNAEG